MEIEDRFTTQTYTLRDGKVIYSKGKDHIIHAVRREALASEQGNLGQGREEKVSLPPLITEPMYI